MLDLQPVVMFALNDQIGFNVHRVALLFRRELTRALKPYGLTPEQWQVLVTLREKGALTQSQIIELTLQDAPSASRTVARMERNGVLERAVSAADRRASIVTLTRSGRRISAAVPRKVLGHFKRYLSALKPAEQKDFLSALKRFRAAFGDSLA